MPTKPTAIRAYTRMKKQRNECQQVGIAPLFLELAQQPLPVSKLGILSAVIKANITQTILKRG